MQTRKRVGGRNARIISEVGRKVERLRKERIAPRKRARKRKGNGLPVPMMLARGCRTAVSPTQAGRDIRKAVVELGSDEGEHEDKHDGDQEEHQCVFDKSLAALPVMPHYCVTPCPCCPVRRDKANGQ